MSDRNTVLRAMHDLGLAAWFGGSMMGAAALNPAAEELPTQTDTARMASSGWAKWTPINAVAIGIHLVGGAGLAMANRQRIGAQKGVLASTIGKAGSPHGCRSGSNCLRPSAGKEDRRSEFARLGESREGRSPSGLCRNRAKAVAYCQVDDPGADGCDRGSQRAAWRTAAPIPAGQRRSPTAVLRSDTIRTVMAQVVSRRTPPSHETDDPSLLASVRRMPRELLATWTTPDYFSCSRPRSKRSS
ncbi:hypothetical protein HEB94_005503 [Actinopolymorpha pittospori]|uniref:Uncharacterized protein n=1 Tax=Actinopolymorpha pittospori TaxID=648752 RepID=A0A927RDZ3_9ACTN|nr:hypothetical protein [Actinopolymorpha pittospori]